MNCTPAAARLPFFRWGWAPPFDSFFMLESNMSDLQSISRNVIDDVSVISFLDTKVMDPARIQVLGEELLALVSEQAPAEKIVINMENVRFLSSAAINKLIVLDKRLKSKGGSLKLCNVTPEVLDVFTITHLNNVFDIRDDQGQAIAAFAG